MLPRKKEDAVPLPRPCFALPLLEEASFSCSHLSWVGDKDGACRSRLSGGDSLPLRWPLWTLWQLLGAALLLPRERHGNGAMLLHLEELLRVVPKASDIEVFGVCGWESPGVSDISREKLRLPVSSLVGPEEPVIHSAADPGPSRGELLRPMPAPSESARALEGGAGLAAECVVARSPMAVTVMSGSLTKLALSFRHHSPLTLCGIAPLCLRRQKR
jgi:hypothetical protein